MPLIEVNEFGKGKTLFMNVEIGHYPFDRLQSSPATSLPHVVGQIFSMVHTDDGMTGQFVQYAFMLRP